MDLRPCLGSDDACGSQVLYNNNQSSHLRLFLQLHIYILYTCACTSMIQVYMYICTMCTRTNVCIHVFVYIFASVQCTCECLHVCKCTIMYTPSIHTHVQILLYTCSSTHTQYVLSLKLSNMSPHSPRNISIFSLSYMFMYHTCTHLQYVHV